MALPRLCIKYYSSYPEYCLEQQPDHQFSDPYWSYCGVAMHNNEFFNNHETCVVKDENDPSKGFDCKLHYESDGYVETDFYLYVTALDSSVCSSALAYAQFCALDEVTNRPLAGNINFCPERLDTDPFEFDGQVETAIHELLHTLVIYYFNYEL